MISIRREQQQLADLGPFRDFRPAKVAFIVAEATAGAATEVLVAAVSSAVGAISSNNRSSDRHLL